MVSSSNRFTKARTWIYDHGGGWLNKAWNSIYNRSGRALNRECKGFYDHAGRWFIASFLLLLFLLLIQCVDHLSHPSKGVSLCFVLPVATTSYASLIMLIWRELTFEKWHFPITVITYFLLSGALCLFLSWEAYTENLTSEPEPSPNLHLKAIEARLDALMDVSKMGHAIDAQQAADEEDAKEKNEKTSHPFLGAFYFTTITFTTVGYGDVLPNGPYGRVFACFVALLGTAHAVFFVTMIVTKLTEITVKPPGVYRRRRR